MRPTPSEVIRYVARRFDVPVRDIKGNSRFREHVIPRHLVATVLRERVGFDGNRTSYPEIARRIGLKDHTSVIHACQTFPWKAERDPELHAIWQDARKFAAGDA